MKRYGRGSELVQGRRQGGVSPPRCRNGREAREERGAQRKAGVPDHSHRARRHDGERPSRELRASRRPQGDRRGSAQESRQVPDERRNRDDEEEARREEGPSRRAVSGGVWAVLVAAGRGERLGEDRPKALVRLCDLPLLAEPMRRLEQSERVDGIVIVAPPDWEEPSILLAE